MFKVGDKVRVVDKNMMPSERVLLIFNPTMCEY